ncbi:MAG: HNH endonuclease family protein [Waterburya sp.]
MSLKQFEQILIYLESYFVRRWLVGISTKSLGKVFDNLYKEVKEENSDNLVEGLCRVLSNYDKTKIWPKNDDFRESIITKAVYKKNDTARVKLILESLEQSSNKKEQIKTGDLTIDHIMPQTLTSEWKKILGSDHNNIKKKWLHTFGNLTLTGYNSELSNKTFNEKKKLYQESNVYLNKYFQKIDNWNEESIKQRAEALANMAIKLWPR